MPIRLSDKRNAPRRPAAKQVSVVYKGDKSLHLDVMTDGESYWLSQKQICALFGRTQTVISGHINKLYKEGVIDPHSSRALFARKAADGKTYQVLHYSLDVVVSIGFRVNSSAGARFRRLLEPLRHHQSTISAFLWTSEGEGNEKAPAKEKLPA